MHPIPPDLRTETDEHGIWESKETPRPTLIRATVAGLAVLCVVAMVMGRISG